MHPKPSFSLFVAPCIGENRLEDTSQGVCSLRTIQRHPAQYQEVIRPLILVRQHNDCRRSDEHRYGAEVRVGEKPPELLLHEENRQVIRTAQERRDFKVRPQQDHVERI